MARNGGGRLTAMLLGAVLVGCAHEAGTERRIPPPAAAATGAQFPREGEGSEPRDAARAAPAGPEVERYFRARFADAKTLFEQGNYRGAFRLADAILTASPKLPLEDDLRRFRRLAEGRYLSGSILHARFEFADSEEFPRRAVRGELAIENISAAPLAIGKPGEACIVGQARWQVTEIYEDASEWTNAGSSVVRAEAGRVLQVGEVMKIPLEYSLPPAQNSPLMQSLTVAGDLLPIEIRVGKNVVTRGVPWVRSEFVALPPGAADRLADPFRELQMALLLEDARTLLVVGAVWAGELARREDGASAEKARAMDLLIAALERGSATFQRAVMRMLERLTGQDLPTAEAWQLWARRKG